MSRSHWIMTWVMADGTRIQESTQDAMVGPRQEPMPEMTEAEARDALGQILSRMAREGGPSPALWLKDRVRGGAPSLVFLGQVMWMEMAPDTGEDPEPAGLKDEADRHLELVREQDPGTQRDTDPHAPGGGLSDPVSPGASTVHPPWRRVRDALEDQGFRGGLPPAGLDRHA